MTIYVYDNDRILIATITRSTNAECEAAACEYYPDTDWYGYTYSPAFGVADGLVDNGSSMEVLR